MLRELIIDCVSEFLKAIKNYIIEDNKENYGLKFLMRAVPKDRIDKNPIISAFKDDEKIVKNA